MEPSNQGEVKQGVMAGGFAARQPRLFCVTKTSKYFAMTLFILLPFLGGYVGYVNAPEKVVEVEKIVYKENLPLDTNQEVVNTEPDNLALATYADDEVGISFKYPVEWGEVSVSNEFSSQKFIDGTYMPFDCSVEYNGDPCNFRTYKFSNLGNNASIFMAAETIGHSENPVARGAFWADMAGNIDKDYLTECELSDICEVVVNNNDISFALYEADPIKDGMGYQPERYYLYNSNSDYYGLVLSTYRLHSDTDGDYAKIFSDTVIDSFDFIPII